MTPMASAGGAAPPGSAPAGRWLLLALLGSLLLNGLVILALTGGGEALASAWSATAPGQLEGLAQESGRDSWGPMAHAFKHRQDHPEGSLYDVLFDWKVKFQYPPSSVVPMVLLPDWLFRGFESVEPGTPLRRGLTVLSLAAWGLTIAIAVRLFGASLAAGGGRTSAPVLRAGDMALAGLLGACYYPLLKGHTLGQVQIFIGLLVAAGLLAQLTHRKALAGFCFGGAALIKPQYGLVLLWGVLKRDWPFAGACVGALAAGLALSVWTFGWDEHLRYLDVLRFIARHGESYWPNQSVNGLMHRLTGNADGAVWSNDFAPYSASVYYTTLISSAAIVAAALWVTWRARRQDPRHDAFDLAVLVMAATMATPIAWEHHYGAWLPIIALTVPVMMQARTAGRFTGPLLLCAYLLMANVVLRPEAMNTTVTILAGSHLLFGAFALFVLCLITRARAVRIPTSTLD